MRSAVAKGLTDAARLRAVRLLQAGKPRELRLQCQSEQAFVDLLAALAETRADLVLPELKSLETTKRGARCTLQPSGLLALLNAFTSGAKPPKLNPCAYPGWNTNFENLINALVGAPGTKIHAEHARALVLGLGSLGPPADSGLAFALARRGALALPHPLLGDAFLAQVAKGSIARGYDDVFAGWERVWPIQTFAASVWPVVSAATEVENAELLLPLVAFATDAQLVELLQRFSYLSGDKRRPWVDALVARPTVEPLLRDRLQAEVKRDAPASSGTDCLVDALGRLLALRGEHWNEDEARFIEAKLMSAMGAQLALPPERRERWRVSHAERAGDVRPTELAWFPSAPVADILAARLRALGADADQYSALGLWQGLALQGEPGLAHLRMMLREPIHRECALRYLPRDGWLVRALLPLVQAARHDGKSHSKQASEVPLQLSEANRSAFLDEHFSELPDTLAISLAESLAHRPEAARWAERLRKSPEATALKARIGAGAVPLATLREEIARALVEDGAAIEQARAKLYRPFGTRELGMAWDQAFRAPTQSEREQHVRQALPWLAQSGASRAVSLAALGVGAIVPLDEVCIQLGPDEALAWWAVWWWTGKGHVDDSDLRRRWRQLERVFGAKLVEPLTAALAEPVTARHWLDELEALHLLLRHGAQAVVLAHLQRHADVIAKDKDRREDLADAFAALLDFDGGNATTSWVETALLGTPARSEVAQRVIEARPSVHWIAALDELAKRPDLSSAKKVALSTLRAQCAAAAPPPPRSERMLQAHVFAPHGVPLKAREGVSSLLVDKKRVALKAGREATVIGSAGATRFACEADANLVFTPDERFIVVWTEEFIERRSLDDSSKPVRISAQSGKLRDFLSDVISLESGATLTRHWGAEAAIYEVDFDKKKLRRLVPGAQAITIVDDAHCAVLLRNGAVQLRDLASGKTLKTFASASSEGEGVNGSIALSGGQTLLALHEGIVRSWHLGERANVPLSEVKVPEGRLSADSESPWAVLVAPNGIYCFEAGMPRRTLPAPWHPMALPEVPNGATASFVAPAIVAIASHAGLDLWDLSKATHLGTHPTMRCVAAYEPDSFLAADDDGSVWQVHSGLALLSTAGAAER